MLRQKGIDLDHNRFLILQGEVEQISMMKPKADNSNDEGMLEYLEDIIGSSRLKPLIEMLNQDWDSKISGAMKNTLPCDFREMKFLDVFCKSEKSRIFSQKNDSSYYVMITGPLRNSLIIT